MHIAVPAERFFKTQFGFAVGVDGVLGSRFADRYFRGIAERGSRAGEHKPFHSALDGGIRQIDGITQIVLEIFARIGHGLAHQRERGKVHHRIVLLFTETLEQKITVLQVAIDKIRPGVHRFPVTGEKAVEHSDFVAMVQQILGTDTADITGTASNKDFFHCQNSFKNVYQ